MIEKFGSSESARALGSCMCSCGCYCTCPNGIPRADVLFTYDEDIRFRYYAQAEAAYA